jgi:UDP-3-O-[3-hydroxymyristoyl] glucosamine N-acyltransferase
VAVTLAELAEKIDARLVGPTAQADGAREVRCCAGLDSAEEADVSFLANPKYAAKVATTRALAVIVSENDAAALGNRTLLVARDPYFAFRNAVVALHGFRQHPVPADGPISSLAAVDPQAEVGEGTVIHPFAVVSAGAKIGRNCVIYPHCFIGPGASVGDDCVLFANVVIYDGCVLGNRVTLHAGCIIGQDGFGYATHDGVHHKIPQIGNAIIEDDVEMGANCAVDRATVGSTIVGAGTKTSDVVTIGHGTRVGRHNLLVALVGLAGSVETGDYVAIGGQVGVAGHLKIGSFVQIAATSGVMDDIPEGQKVGGTPALPLTEAKRLHLSTLRLPDLIAKVKRLEREIEKLKNPSA